jgi:hypothetical protein
MNLLLLAVGSVLLLAVGLTLPVPHSVSDPLSKVP